MKRIINIIIAAAMLTMAACNATSEGKHEPNSSADTARLNKTARPFPTDSMAAIFSNLPHDDANVLRKGLRDSILKFKTVTIKDSMEDMIYTLDSIAPDYLSLEYNEGGTHVFEEIKRFKKNAGGHIAVLSIWAAQGAGFVEQWEIKVYNCEGSNISANKDNVLPPDTDLRHFLKPNTPDSLMKNVSITSINNHFDLLPQEKNKIEFILGVQVDMGDSIYALWMKNRGATYTWNGSSFVETPIPLNNNN